MGGRTSGESPREVKAGVTSWAAATATPCQRKAVDELTSTARRQAPTQQPTLDCPCGQQDFCEVWPRVAIVPAQFADICAAAASMLPAIPEPNAAPGPCKHMASTTSNATSRRLMESTIAPRRHTAQTITAWTPAGRCGSGVKWTFYLARARRRVPAAVPASLFGASSG